MRGKSKPSPAPPLRDDVPSSAETEHRGEIFDLYRYATEETVELSPLPCWKDLSDETRLSF
jgi:hypothetical protein